MEDNLDQIRKAAAALDCLIEEDFQDLAGITANTARSWRNRGRAPKPVLFGTRYFYPLSSIREVIAERVQEQMKSGVVL